MKAYIYDEITKEFLYDTLIQENPLNTEEWLMPSNSTLISPPIEQGKVACFEEEEWILKTDHRGHWQVKLDDVTFTVVDYIGEAQEGYQFISDEVFADYQADNDKYKVVDGVFTDISDTEEYLNIIKDRRNNENTLKAKEAVEEGYVVYKDAEFETNAQTVGDLTATMLLMQASGMETYTWLSRDDKVVELTLEDFGTLGGLIAQYKNNIWSIKYLDFKQQIALAETLEEVNAIVIDYNVPENDEEEENDLSE